MAARALAKSSPSIDGGEFDAFDGSFAGSVFESVESLGLLSQVRILPRPVLACCGDGGFAPPAFLPTEADAVPGDRCQPMEAVTVQPRLEA